MRTALFTLVAIGLTVLLLWIVKANTLLQQASFKAANNTAVSIADTLAATAPINGFNSIDTASLNLAKIAASANTRLPLAPTNRRPDVALINQLSVNASAQLSKASTALHIYNKLDLPLVNLFKAQPNESQFFQIEANQQSLISTPADGAKIYIPPHAFTNAFADTLQGNITIEWKALYDPYKWILNGIPGNVGNAHLNIDGSIYIAATQNDKILNLRPNVSLWVELPTYNYTPEQSIYYAQTKPLGIVWSKGNTANEAPLSLPNGFVDYSAFPLYSSMQTSLQEAAAKQELLQTREIEQRFALIAYTQAVHPKIKNEAAGIILSNSWRSLTEIDYRLSAYFKKQQTAYILKVKNEVGGVQIPNENISLLPSQKDSLVALIKLTKQFYELYTLKQKRPIATETYTSIEWADPQRAYRQLRWYGVNSSTALKRINQYHYKSLLFQARQQGKIPQPSFAQMPIAQHSFALFNTGWFAIAHPYPFPQSYTQLSVTTNLTKPHIYLITDAQQAAVRPTKINGNTQSFRAIPKGVQAKVIAIAYKNELPYYAEAQIETGNTLVLDLQMRPTTTEQLAYLVRQRFF